MGDVERVFIIILWFYSLLPGSSDLWSSSKSFASLTKSKQGIQMALFQIDAKVGIDPQFFLSDPEEPDPFD